jgi:MFS transporter, FSR family, fosmidomycin resistance protein
MINKSSSKSQFIFATSSHAITDLYASFIIGLIPVFALKFNLSLFMISILTSTSSISGSLTQPVFGYLADKYGYRYFLLAGPLFSAVFISLMPIMPSYYLVIIFLFLGNLSIAAFHPSNASISGHFGGRRKGLGSAVISFSGTFGYSMGSIFVILIVEKMGIRFTPLAMIPGVLMTLIMIKYMPGFSLVNKNKIKIKFFEKIINFNKIKIILLIIIFIASLGRDLMWLALLTFMPVYYTNAKISLTNIGYILMLFNLIGATGSLLAGFYWDRIEKKLYLLQAGIFIALPFLYFTFKTHGIISIILFLFGGFFIISTLLPCIRISHEILPSNIGLASSLVMGLSTGSAAVIMIGVGKIADYTGIVKIIDYLLILPAISFFLLFFLPFLYRKQKNYGGERGI